MYDFCAIGESRSNFQIIHLQVIQLTLGCHTRAHEIQLFILKYVIFSYQGRWVVVQDQCNCPKIRYLFLFLSLAVVIYLRRIIQFFL